MQLRTYTGLWNVEKRLYKFYDVNLPYPVSIRQIAVFFGTLVPWFGLMSLVGLPFHTPWHLVWLAPPIAATYYANRPVAEGKTLVDYAGSQIRFWLSAKHYAALSAIPAEPETVKVSGSVWRRSPN